MKGMVFTEFLEMVDARFSADMVDDIIDDAQLPNGGAYTAVGTYDHAELVRMVVALSQRTGVAVPVLIEAFGVHLFGQFRTGYPAFFAGVACAVDFLEGIETVIHTEVRKLYPDAQLPSFDSTRQPNGGLDLLYSSPRHFGDLATGLIKGAIAHFGDAVSLVRVDVPEQDAIRFELRALG
jgi:Haem-NO-binding